MISFVAKAICLIPGGAGEAVGNTEDDFGSLPGPCELAGQALETQGLAMATHTRPNRTTREESLGGKWRGIPGIRKVRSNDATTLLTLLST